MKKSKILTIILPLTAILLCYAAYEYGYVTIASKVVELREIREQKEKMIFKYVAAISKRQQIAGTLNFLRPVKTNYDDGMIHEPLPAGAVENLRNILREIITHCGGQMKGDTGAQPVKSGIYMIYEIEVDMALPDTKALNDIVYEIESNTLYMVIKHMDVRVTNPKSPGELSAKFKIAAIGIGR